MQQNVSRRCAVAATEGKKVGAREQSPRARRRRRVSRIRRRCSGRSCSMWHRWQSARTCGACGRNGPGRGRDAPLPAPPWSSGPAYPGQGRRGDLAARRPARSAAPRPTSGRHPGAARLAVGPAADLAAALGPDEADPVADLRPVDRVEVAQLRLDRHGLFRLQASRAAVRARGRWWPGRSTRTRTPLICWRLTRRRSLRSMNWSAQPDPVPPQGRSPPGWS